MDTYIMAIKTSWDSLKSLAKLTNNQIKSIDNDCIRMYLYCYYDYPEFYNYKKKKLLNRYINEDKENLMLFASFIGNIDLIIYLEQNGLDINHKAKNYADAYLISSKLGHIHILEYLESRGANINTIDKWLHNSYILAARFNKLDVLKYLETKCVDKYKRNCDGFNAYLVAACSGHVNILKYFLQSNHDIYVKNYNGDNAYLLAATYGHLDAFKYLETLDFDIYEKYKDNNMNAYQVASSRPKIIEYLESKVLYLGYQKICSICYETKDDKFITCKSNHIVHLKCQQSIYRHMCAMCSFRYVI
jgi:ankyrin repeat protein